MSTDPAWKHPPSLLALGAAAAFAILLAVLFARGAAGGMMGFPGIYYGTQCLLHHGDPYNPAQLHAFYAAAGAVAPGESAARLQAVTLYVNLPPTFLFVAPFTFLPLSVAQALWCSLLVAAFLLATLLMWQLAAAHARRSSLLLAGLLVSNSFIVFSGGNTAGLVVALTVLACWCFLQSRFPVAGVVALAIALTIKPHDSGLLWLYFLLAGPLLRRRALQSAALAAAFVLASFTWVSLAVPRWLPEMRSNLALISAPGGINQPGPASIGVNTPDMIVSLQTVFSVFRDTPAFYNTATWLLCGLLFLAWVRAVRRAAFSPLSAWLALSAAAALSMLVTYHRSYDARLLLVAIPACALLWPHGRARAVTGLTLTALALFFTADLPLTVLSIQLEHMPMNPPGLAAKLAAVLLGRPAPLCLLAAAVFYIAALTRLDTRQPTPAA